MFLDVLVVTVIITWLITIVTRKQCRNCRYHKANMYGHPCEPCIKSEGHINWRKK